MAFSLFAEFVPLSKRGVSLVVVQGAFWSGGALVSALLAWITLPTLGWRAYLVSGVAPGLGCPAQNLQHVR